jgi:hypothetical protein
MTRQTSGLFGGALAFGLILLLPAPEGMSPLAQRAAAVTVLMAVWWMTEAIPIAGLSAHHRIWSSSVWCRPCTPKHRR